MSDGASAVGSLKMKYFVPPMGLAGRGGTVRFFALRRGVPWEDDSFPYEQLAEVKREIISSGLSPTGLLPIVYQDGRPLTEHRAILRRFSRQMGEYGKDLERDTLVDMAASLLSDWRSAWGTALFSGDKDKYPAERPGLYSMWEQFLERAGGSGACVVAGGRSFADDMLFGQLYDDGTSYGFEALARQPKLHAFYDAYKAQPAIAQLFAAASAKA